MKTKRDYAVYRGDEFVTVGNQEDVARELGVKPGTIYFWTTPTYNNRLKEDSKALRAIRLEDD